MLDYCIYIYTHVSHNYANKERETRVYVKTFCNFVHIILLNTPDMRVESSGTTQNKGSDVLFLDQPARTKSW